MSLTAYLRIWLASARYSVTRALMFRFDFFLWVLVDTAWMAVNLLLIEIVYRHVDSMAGWSKPEMILLAGTSLLIMRLSFAFFLANLTALDRHVREGTLDFLLAQPGNPLFMLSTRKVELDSFFNVALAIGVIIYAANELGLSPSIGEVVCYALMILFGLLFHYSVLVMVVASAFWTTRIEGMMEGYFAVFEFSRLPRPALRGVWEIVFVYLFPAVIVSNFPAQTLLLGPANTSLLWLAGIACAWFLLAVAIFNAGLRRYTSASS